MKLKKPPKPKKRDFTFKKKQKDPPKSTADEQAEKARLIRAWLRKGNKIKKIPPVYKP
jgi:hypothetical protein